MSVRKRLRTVAAVGALALIASSASVLMPQTAQAAPGDPFSPNDPFVFVAQGFPTQLFKALTNASGSTTFQAEGPPAGQNYNAIAYNTADNYIYAVTPPLTADPADSALLRIGENGVITRVGTGVVQAAAIGSFGPGGDYYTIAGLNLERVNVTTGTVVSDTPIDRPINGLDSGGNDIAFKDGFFWSMGSGQLIRIEPATGAMAVYQLADLGITAPAGDQAGAAWVYGNGNLGFAYNNAGIIFQLAITNAAADPAREAPTVKLIATSPLPATASNDGTSSPGQPTDLAITKSSPAATVAAGGTATYTLKVTNNGPGNSSGFVVNDTVPAGLTNVTVDSNACTVTGNAVSCVSGRMLAGNSVTYTVTAQVPAGVTAAISNTATVTPNEIDPNGANNTSTTTAQPASIALQKTAGTPVDANADGLTDTGDTIAFSFAVTNTGSAPLTNISVNDAKAGAVVCPPGALAAGATITCAPANPYVITDADVANGSVDNSATATGTTADGVAITSAVSSTSTQAVAADPAISLEQSVDPSDPASFTAGRQLAFRFTVRNTGNVPMSNVLVSPLSFSGSGAVPVITCPATAIPVNGQLVCTATYVLTQADVAAGSITFRTLAVGDPAGSTPLSSNEAESRLVGAAVARAIVANVLASTGAGLVLPVAGTGLLLLLVGGSALLYRRRRA